MRSIKAIDQALARLKYLPRETRLKILRAVKEVCEDQIAELSAPSPAAFFPLSGDSSSECEGLSTN